MSQVAGFPSPQYADTVRFLCTFWGHWRYRTLILLQRYMPDPKLYSLFLVSKGNFTSHYLEPFQLSDEIKDVEKAAIQAREI